MMDDVYLFQEEKPSLESYWRSIILFGRNVASYKFALAKTLLEIAPKEITEISLEELAIPYSKHLCEHLMISPKQTTSNSSSFLKACDDYNKKIISKEELIKITVNKGFKDVIDAFHVVNQNNIPIEFYKKDYNSSFKKIILTDKIFELKENNYFGNYKDETESRWNLVETAWELGISKNLLQVKYDKELEKLFVESSILRRKEITSARNSLNGYQKGKCFYCFDDIDLNVIDNNKLCDVDHFFPFILFNYTNEINFDGIWNLVLSCRRCNRGENGKFAKVPKIKYLERLHKRNEFLISSHHPLRDTLIKQTGKTKKERVNFLKKVDFFSISHLIHRWEPNNIGEELY